MSKKVLCGSLSSIHILYHQALVGGLSDSFDPATRIGGRAVARRPRPRRPAAGKKLSCRTTCASAAGRPAPRGRNPSMAPAHTAEGICDTHSSGMTEARSRVAARWVRPRGRTGRLGAAKNAIGAASGTFGGCGASRNKSRPASGYGASCPVDSRPASEYPCPLKYYPLS